MRKLLIMLVLSTIISTLTGCGDGKGINVNDFTQNTNTADNQIQNYNQSDNETFVDDNLGSYNTGIQPNMVDFSTLGPEYQAFLDVPVDIDVVDLNDIVAFAQVNNMMTMADDYLGQTVKVHGNYYRHDIEEMNVSYHFLLLVDGTNCCTGILEFKMPDDVDYPESGENLLLMGEYSKYTDEYGTYPYIIVSDYLTY